jgi:arginyl-tRNA synthetase
MIAESRWAEGQRKIQLALWEAAERLLASVPLEQIEVMAPTEEGHGDFTSNLAFRLAKPLSKAPVKIAAELASGLPSLALLERVEVAGAGFINFWLNSKWLSDTVSEAVRHPDSFGESASRQERVLIEFVSANPTGPLVVVNGRAAAWGDSLARVMSAAGYDVDREFYVNDAGMQVVKLGNALAIRLEELKGAPLPETWPEGVYPGEYVRALAQDYAESHGTWKSLGLQEQYWPELGRWAAERLRAQQEAELLRFGVTFDRWYSEKRLRQEGKPEAVVAELDERNQLYQAEGARWFRSIHRYVQQVFQSLRSAAFGAGENVLERPCES